jgi:hypothetical protein
MKLKNKKFLSPLYSPNQLACKAITEAKPTTLISEKLPINTPSLQAISASKLKFKLRAQSIKFSNFWSGDSWGILEVAVAVVEPRSKD